ncbi:MAG: serine/threonine protein kinase, partial [Deltaproteobacteria bacterium]|nr:serine/threonine protein kinase [Deltaproteobacteria bacterium]
GIAVWLSGIVFRLGRRIHKAEQMGRYRLTKRLGRGGMGEVWRAEHEMLARPAAIKLIRPERLGEVDSETGLRMLRRFEREVQTTATLTSPHTIELYDFGRTPDGAFFYVMELLNGLDLATLVERFGPLSPDRVAYLLIQVCSSLSEAHLAGLIHRDIKPANIYLCRKGIEYDYVKVLDFGLVKTMGDTHARETRLTAEGVAAGSPAFMAPEVATAGVVDSRVDLYSLGCVAYWLLTGQVVFEGTSAVQVVMQHVQNEPTPPSRRTELEIPPALEQIVMDCLAKSPSDRPGSADELAQRLRESGLAVAWSADRAQRWWERHLPEHMQSKGLQTPAALAEGGLSGA